jgi:Tfp pilus assembly protein PilN
MVLSIFENHLLSILVLLVLGSVGLLHFLLFREYIRQDKIQSKRLVEMEAFLQTEFKRSLVLNNQKDELSQIKEKSQEQLDLIKLQVKSIEINSKKNKL